MFELTRVRVQLHEPPVRPDGRKDWRFKGVAEIVIDDCLAIKDIKILTASNGNLFVAFPTRKVEDYCPDGSCRERVALKDRFCRRCGVPLEPDRGVPGLDGKVGYYISILHPVTSEVRDTIQDVILEAYHDAHVEKYGVPPRGDHSASLVARVRAEVAA